MKYIRVFTLLYPETYSEPCQTFAKELFAETAPVIIQKPGSAINRSSLCRCSSKSVFLRPASLLKSDSNTGEICEIFKNTFFREHLRWLHLNNIKVTLKYYMMEQLNRKRRLRNVFMIKKYEYWSTFRKLHLPNALRKHKIWKVIKSK